jgi:hypothetical protein
MVSQIPGWQLFIPPQAAYLHEEISAKPRLPGGVLSFRASCTQTFFNVVSALSDRKDLRLRVG